MGQQRSVARRDRIREHRATPQAAHGPSRATGCPGPGTRTPPRRAAVPSRSTPPRCGPPLRQRFERLLRLPDIVGTGPQPAHRSASGATPPCAPPPPTIRLRMRPQANPPSAPPAHAAPPRPGQTPAAAASRDRRPLRPGSPSRDAPRSGASSRSTCALVPQMPNAAHPRPPQLCPPHAATAARSCSSDSPLPCPRDVLARLVRVQRLRQAARAPAPAPSSSRQARPPPPACGRSSTSTSQATADDPSRPRRPKHLRQRARLDRIAQRWSPCRAPPPRRCRQARRPLADKRAPDHPLLARTIGRRQPLAATVLVHRAAAHHRQHCGRHRAPRPTAASAPAPRSPHTSPPRRPPPRSLAAAVRRQPALAG